MHLSMPNIKSQFYPQIRPFQAASLSECLNSLRQEEGEGRWYKKNQRQYSDIYILIMELVLESWILKLEWLENN